VRKRKAEPASNAADAGISLSGFVLDTIEQVRGLGGEGAADPDLARVSISSVTISIPCDSGAGQPPVRSPSRPLRPHELKLFLRANERTVVLNRNRLRDLPDGRLARLDLTVHFRES